MLDVKAKNIRYKRELSYQIIIHILLFVAFSVTKKEPTIEWYELFAFLNYALCASIVSYLIIPHYYKNRKIVWLISSFILVLLSCILIEELIIEQIFFPEDRGKNLQIFWTVISVLSKLSLFIAFKLVWDLVYIRQEVDSLKLIAKQNELQFLKSQINPHFLFNNLNNLYSYALEQSPKTPEIILELSGLLRYMLYECNQELTPLNKEIEQLENFIKLNEYQIENRGRIERSFKGQLEKYQVAPLILIVFVENAFKHCLGSMSDNIEIDINAFIKDDTHLIFSCSNNFSNDTNNEKVARGIGLENVRKRLDLIYGNNYELTISITEKSYEVYLSLPINSI